MQSSQAAANEQLAQTRQALELVTKRHAVAAALAVALAPASDAENRMGAVLVPELAKLAEILSGRTFVADRGKAAGEQFSLVLKLAAMLAPALAARDSRAGAASGRENLAPAAGARGPANPGPAPVQRPVGAA